MNDIFLEEKLHGKASTFGKLQLHMILHYLSSNCSVNFVTRFGYVNKSYLVNGKSSTLCISRLGNY